MTGFVAYFFYNEKKGELGDRLMVRSAKIYQMNHDFKESELPVSEKQEREYLSFYRFIGGNLSDTEDLVNQLRELREKTRLLIGVFRFPFRFEGKKRLETAITQYFHMKELCDAVIYFKSDGLMETIDAHTNIHESNLMFIGIEDYIVETLRETIEMTGEMNIDFQDIESFIKGKKGPLFLHTIEGDSFDEPLKYLISTPYLPEDFTDGTQLIINIGYTRDVDMEAFRQINLRLHDLFSKADLFKLGSYLIDEPGQTFRITLLVNGMDDPIEAPHEFKEIPKQRGLFSKWEHWVEYGFKNRPS